MLDLVQNSISAHSSLIKLLIHENDILTIELIDNGKGMSDEEKQQALSPYYTSRVTRKVGLGLSMMKMLTEQTEGVFNLTSQQHKGTKLSLQFNPKHIDLPEMGDIGELIYLISIHQDVEDFIFIYQKGNQTYQYHLKEIKDILGDALQTFSVMKALIKSINEEIQILRGKL